MKIDITIIADNGGGLTLQIIDDGGSRYQHSYDDPKQCARDIRDAALDGHFRGWEGNEAEDEDENDQWLIPTDEQEHNGGYRVLTVTDLTGIDPEMESWRNVKELAEAFEEE